MYHHFAIRLQCIYIEGINIGFRIHHVCYVHIMKFQRSSVKYYRLNRHSDNS